MSTGISGSAFVPPKKVYKAAILANASSLILARNHPSGDPNLSEEDRRITKRSYEAGQLPGIDVQDYVVVGEKGRFYSLKQSGQM